MAQSGQRDPQWSPNSVQAVGQPGTGTYTDSRVTLLNAPCGSDSTLETFLTNAKALTLVNKLVKLPANDWKLRQDGVPKSICKFMADSGARLALFQIVPSDCSTCVAPIVLEAKAIPEAATKVFVVLVVAGGSITSWMDDHRKEISAEDKLVVLHDENAALLTELRSKTELETFPKFLLHVSGYGAFANTNGKPMDGLSLDFQALAAK